MYIYLEIEMSYNITANFPCLSGMDWLGGSEYCLS